MSHLNIFQFSESPIRKEDYISDTDLYDSYGSVDPLLAYTEYFGDEVEDRKEALESLKRELEPYAQVDIASGVIRFHEKPIVKKAFMEKISETFEKFKTKFGNENASSHDLSMAEWKLRHEVCEVGVSDIFYSSYCRHFSVMVADYLAGYIPQTIYIGAILDVKE